MGQSYGPKIVTDGLVFCVDAASNRSYSGGSGWVDLAGNNDGTLTNGPAFSSDNAGSIVFDGSDDYLLVNDSADLRVSTKKTFEMWVKFDTLDVSTAISLFVKRFSNGVEEEYFIFIWTTSLDELTFDYGNSGDRWATGYVPTLNEWLHIVLNVDTTLPERNFYLNGEFQAQDTTSLGTLNGYANDVHIGVRQDKSAYLLNGNIGLARIYNKFLTANEIRQNYNATKGRFGL